jgi:Thoeris protein ThsB, TIR-like domain
LRSAFKGKDGMHNVFISYHHHNDQSYKEQLLLLNILHGIFEDYSVDTGAIDDDLDDSTIRELIRDEYLRDSTVTILLVGTETKNRKHVDWEIYSSMYDGRVNKKSGILVVNLPTVDCYSFTAAHDGEKERVYPEFTDWRMINNRIDYELVYPYMPARIIDNLLRNDVKISVVNWSRIENDPSTLSFLIDVAFNDRAICNYDLSRPMRRANS